MSEYRSTALFDWINKLPVGGAPLEQVSHESAYAGIAKPLKKIGRAPPLARGGFKLPINPPQQPSGPTEVAPMNALKRL